MLNTLLQPPSAGTIFNFGIFFSALALLGIIYTVTDVRFRFRIAVAPVPLHFITYIMIAIIGFGTLITDLWFAENWPLPNFLSDQLIWQAILGGMFLWLILIWIYYGLINPPIFQKNNYKKFTEVFYSIALKGTDNELSVIVNELARSAESIISNTKLVHVSSSLDIKKSRIKNIKPSQSDYAHDFLLLIGNRKFCRYIITSSPTTAIDFFHAMSNQKKYDVPIGAFSKNVSTEAIIYKDSILYHEDEGYKSGLIGYLKPFTQTVYGNYVLVEELAKNNASPLDIRYELLSSWDAIQLEAYCRCVEACFKSYIKNNAWFQHSYALHRAFNIIKDSCRDLYKLNDIPVDALTDISKRLHVVVHFITKIIAMLDKQEPILPGKLRLRDKDIENFYDYIANLMFEIVSFASHVKSPSAMSWGIQYITVWDQFFGYTGNGNAKKIINHKLRRLLFDEILRLSKFPNYRSARILGLCLNVMGLELGDRKHKETNYALHKVILIWTKHNYLKLRSNNLEVSESCLQSNITFDEQKKCLIKTFEKGLNKEPHQSFLNLSD